MDLSKHIPLLFEVGDNLAEGSSNSGDNAENRKEERFLAINISEIHKGGYFPRHHWRHVSVKEKCGLNWKLREREDVVVGKKHDIKGII